MKAKTFLVVILLLALTLSACGGAEEAESGEVALADIYTAAALTVTAQSLSVTATATLPPSASPTPWPTVTVSLINTPTAQSASYAASTAYGCNDAVYVSDVTIADGSELAPGEEFVKTWKLQNAGSCAWDEDYQIVFVSGEDMEGEETDIGDTVSAGSTANISVSLVAPDAEGTYTGYWRMADDSGNLFGGAVYVMIVVTEDAATSTPTATEEETATETPTSTPVPTETEIPTDTPEPTEEPTAAPETGDDSTE
ncbi:MAG: NBR1-Ig-like domain-containing protein [Chloroflexota bacterium]